MFSSTFYANNPNTPSTSLKIDVSSPADLSGLANYLTRSSGLKYLRVNISGQDTHDLLYIMAQALESHKTLLSFEINSSSIASEKTITALRELVTKNSTLMSCALITNGKKRDFCLEIQDEKCAPASAKPKTNREQEELAKQFQPIANVMPQQNKPAPAPVLIRPIPQQPPVIMPEVPVQYMPKMNIPERRLNELENMLMPEVRAYELESYIAQAQQQQEQTIRDAEHKISQEIENSIASQNRMQQQNIYDLEQKLAQDEKNMRDLELQMNRDVNRFRFGLLPPVISAPQPPKQPQVKQQTKHIPFTKDEIALVRDYIEDIYTHSNSAIEKRAIDKLRCPISSDIMEFPVFLIPDERTYDRCELIKMLASGKNTCPLSGRPFTERDMRPDHGTISIIQEYLEEAVKAKSKLEAGKMKP